MTMSSSMSLSVLLDGMLDDASVLDIKQDRLVESLCIDSRKAVPGAVFIACLGLQVHAIYFADQAVSQGAVAVLCEMPSPDDVDIKALSERLAVPVIPVAALSDKLGWLATRFYVSPAAAMHVIGMTGTNGKTSCTHYLAQILSLSGHGCGVLGTLGYGMYGALKQGLHTTPDAVTVQQELADLRAAGAEYVAMEVSSHALEQGRVAGVQFDTAVFINLSHDHLDYHGDMTRYGQAKFELFNTPGLRFAVMNIDDEFVASQIADVPETVQVLRYGLVDNLATNTSSGRSSDKQAGVEVRGNIIDRDMHGMKIQIVTPWGEGSFETSLLGEFNASNLLAVLTVLGNYGMPLDDLLKFAAAVEPVAGRMERFGGDKHQPLVVVDYAHTPDALEHALSTLRGHCQGQLWCVFGCGGDRDRSKRSLMGAIAEQYADHVCVTDDNPRTESAQQIIDDVLSTMNDVSAVSVIRDRGEAISKVLSLAAAQDVVLIAGKGHEDYQIIGDQRQPFSDSEQVRKILGEVA